MAVTDITFPSSTGRPMRAAIAAPEGGAGRYPGIIVIHEIFGLNGDIRRITERMAGLGYVVMAPDLYDGDRARILCIAQTMMAMRNGQGKAFDDLDAARKFLCAQPNVDASRIGAIGFCMGGGFALLYAVRAPLGATGVFYGDVPKSADQLKGVCPVLGGYGESDRLFAAQGKRLDELLSAMGVDHDVKIYPGAGHSFMSPHTGLMATLGSWGPMRVGYDPAAAEDSWKRIEQFFGKHLQDSARAAD